MTFLHIMQAGGPHQEPVCAWLSRAAAGIQCSTSASTPGGAGHAGGNECAFHGIRGTASFLRVNVATSTNAQAAR